MKLGFGPHGLAAVHASLLDAQSLTCESNWVIAEDGGIRNANLELGYARAMATIVCHSSPSGRQAVTRRLAPRRWAFGWRVDERRLVVAEVRYRAAREAFSDADMALVRRLCDARIRCVSQGAVLRDKAAEPPEATSGRVLHAAAEGRAVEQHRPAGAGAAPTLRRGRRWLLRSLFVLVLGIGGLGWVHWLRSEAMASEMQRLQALSDATLAQGIAAALDRGDYGEVQAELDHFEKLRYFDAAIVTNARGQVVSKSDRVHGVRIGETFTPEPAAGSRSIELVNGSARGLGRLHIWPYRSAS